MVNTRRDGTTPAAAHKNLLRFGYHGSYITTTTDVAHDLMLLTNTTLTEELRWNTSSDIAGYYYCTIAAIAGQALNIYIKELNTQTYNH